MAIKLNKTYTDAIKDYLKKQSSIEKEAADIGLLELSIQKRKKDLFALYEYVSKLQKDLGQKLINDYGEGTVDPNTLEYIPKKSK